MEHYNNRLSLHQTYQHHLLGFTSTHPFLLLKVEEDKLTLNRTILLIIGSPRDKQHYGRRTTNTRGQQLVCTKWQVPLKACAFLLLEKRVLRTKCQRPRWLLTAGVLKRCSMAMLEFQRTAIINMNLSHITLWIQHESTWFSYFGKHLLLPNKPKKLWVRAKLKPHAKLKLG